MKKFLILPCIAVLAACSSNNETATVPVQPQPIVKPMVDDKKPTTPTVKEKQPEKKPEAKPEDKPKPVAPVKPATPSPLPPAPIVAPAPAAPKQPPALTLDKIPAKTESAGSNDKVAKSAEIVTIKRIGTSGKIQLPTGDTPLPNTVQGGVKAYQRDNSTVYLLNPTKFGFEYQTFGPVYTTNNQDTQIEGYLSTGTRYTPDESKTFSATYHGAAVGTHEKRDNVVSRLTANLKWEAGKKSLTIQTSESKMEAGDQLVEKPDFDFTQKMTWDSQKNQFSNNEGSQGYLYGDAAQEVGGIFKVDSKQYEGGFGATREEQ